MSQADDPSLAEWLAAATGEPVEQVRRELDDGERRRSFVTAELVEAGYTGRELLDRVVQLTGLDEVQARALIAAHRS